MNDKKKKLIMAGTKDHDTPLERILRRPVQLFVSLVANKEIQNPQDRTMPIEETLIFIANNFESGEA